MAEYAATTCGNGDVWAGFVRKDKQVLTLARQLFSNPHLRIHD
jgi:hypothetical protein